MAEGSPKNGFTQNRREGTKKPIIVERKESLEKVVHYNRGGETLKVPAPPSKPGKEEGHYGGPRKNERST